VKVPGGLRLLIFLLFVERMAGAMIVAIVAFQMYAITGRELDLGLLGLAQFVPVFVLSPFAGSLADRFDRRKVLAIGLVLEVSVAVAMAVLSILGLSTAAPIFALMFLFGAAKAIVSPAGRALPIDLAPGQLVGRVVALKTMTFYIGTIFGPLVGAFLFDRSPELPYVFAGALYLFTITALVKVPRSPVRALRRASTGRERLRDAFEGLRLINRSPVLRGTITLDLFAVLLGGAVALLPAIAEQRLGVGAIGYGWLLAAIGIGSFLGSSFLTIRPMKRHAGRNMLVAVGLFGVTTIVLGVATNYWVALAALVFMGASDSVSVVVRSAVVPLATPEEMRGRVLAVENVFIGGSNELGAVESGVVGQWLGASLAVVTGGIGTLVVVALWWKLFPALRSIDRIEDVKPFAH